MDLPGTGNGSSPLPPPSLTLPSEAAHCVWVCSPLTDPSLWAGHSIALGLNAPADPSPLRYFSVLGLG